jgi:outer membrane protein assembly factor BamB
MQRAVSLLFLTLCLVTSSLVFAADWPGWRGANGDGISTETGINKDWATKTPPVLWSVPMYDGGYAGPAIVGGVVYILDHKNGKDLVRALDERTGETLWECPFDEREGGTRSTVAVADGRVFAFSRNARAVCIDATTGKVIWTRQLRDDFKGGPPAAFGFGSSPLVDGKQVIFCPGNRSGATVVALTVDTGETIWQTGSEQTGYGTPMVATFGGVRQYLVLCGTALLGIKPDTGEQLWRYPWSTQENCNGNAPLVLGETVMLGSGYNHGSALIKIDGNTATKVWENREAFSSKTCSPILYKGCIYTIGENRLLGCFDYKTGKILWTKGFFSDGNWTGGLCLVDDTLFVMNHLDSAVVMVKPSPTGY